MKIRIAIAGYGNLGRGAECAVCAAEDMELYARGLRADQTLYVAPCEGMPTERIKELSVLHRTILA